MTETVGDLLNAVMKQVLQTFQTLISTVQKWCHNPWLMPTSQDDLLFRSLRGVQAVVGSAPRCALCPRKGLDHVQLLSTFLSTEHLQGGEARHGEGLVRPPSTQTCNAAHSTEWMGPGSEWCSLGSTWLGLCTEHKSPGSWVPHSDLSCGVGK